ncbi:lateral organ boundaries domain-containing protein [Artemisia annua]|uniref:Lateral organ boundaries domain-containing protein n=1 Tax=Artemisia annua TaxID=35608 RepID=A0A2U1M5N2_ARTAN|nr:lateral organ boundaries domain-containing protein [Artemisia annua]
MTFKGATTTQACAACKYQRKRCTPQCALAPHFRPEHPTVFRNVHKLFGVRNILKILEQINPHHKNEAMRSIIYEANMRDRFPIQGCLTIVCNLQCQIRQAEEELYTVLTQLALYKQQHERQQVRSLIAFRDTLQLGIGVLQPESTSNTLLRNDATPTLPFSLYDNTNIFGNALWFQETDNTSHALHKSLVLKSSNIKEVMHDHQDEIYPFFDI